MIPFNTASSATYEFDTTKKNFVVTHWEYWSIMMSMLEINAEDQNTGTCTVEQRKIFVSGFNIIPWLVYSVVQCANSILFLKTYIHLEPIITHVPQL